MIEGDLSKIPWLKAIEWGEHVQPDEAPLSKPFVQMSVPDAGWLKLMLKDGTELVIQTSEWATVYYFASASGMSDKDDVDAQ